MGTEEEAQKKIQQYADLAKGNKDIDVATLMISALEQERREEIAAKKKRRVYLISITLPPLGLLIAAWYFFSDKPDGKRVALNCVILTAIAGLLFWGISALVSSSLGPNTDAQLKKVENINARQMQQMLGN